MIEAYWLIGQQIVEEEQNGQLRAEYGKNLLGYLAQRLTREFGKGFDQSNLRYIRLFYKTFPIRDAVRHELTWTHYRLLLKVSDEAARAYYITESIECQWNTRDLERNINSFYYQRILKTQEHGLISTTQNEKDKNPPYSLPLPP